MLQSSLSASFNMKKRCQGDHETFSSTMPTKKAADISNFDVLPEDVLQHILSFLSQAKHMAVASTVCKQFYSLLQQTTCLQFPRTLQEKHGPASGFIIMAMVARMSCLRELVVYCSYDNAALFSWILNSRTTLRTLELRMDSTATSAESDAFLHLEHISFATTLQTLKLWGPDLTSLPASNLSSIRPFNQLIQLEITGATLSDTAFAHLQTLCPGLKKLRLVAADGLREASFVGAHLESLCLHASGKESCSVLIESAPLKHLDVHGAKSITVTRHSLEEVAIANLSGAVEAVKIEGDLLRLTKLSLQGGLWRWRAMADILAAATNCEDLVMGVEFCFEHNEPQAFPNSDLSDFFTAHPRLRRFDCRGSMFASLSSSSSLRKVGPETCLLYLEIIYIKIRSHLNIKNKIATLSTILQCSKKLRLMEVRLSQIQDSGKSMNELYTAVSMLQRKYSCIKII